MRGIGIRRTTDMKFKLKSLYSYKNAMRKSATYSLRGNPFANYKEFAEYGDENIGILEAKCSGTCGQCGGGGGHCAKCGGGGGGKCGASFKTKTAKRAKK